VSLGYHVTFPLPLIPAVALYAGIGGLSAVLANRGLSIFHDGLRPTIPAVRSGEISRHQISRTSFTLAWGFFWAFGIPYTLGFVIPLVYMIFMLTDWIGVSAPADHSVRWYRSNVAIRGVAQALVVGALYGAVTAVALHFVAIGMRHLPVQMANPAALITAPGLGAFFLFAVLTSAYHFGMRPGLVGAAAASLTWFVASGLGLAQPPSWALGAAFIVLLAQLVRQIRSRHCEHAAAAMPSWALEADQVEEESEDERAFLRQQVRRIWGGIVPIVVLSALVGAAYNWGLLATEPIAGGLYAAGLAVPAFLVMLAWMFAFVPMKFTTAAMTGCMATGTFLDAGIAVLMPNPLVAALAVGALRILEVAALLPVVRLLEQFPSIREVADVMRTAIFHVMEIGFLAGGAIVAMHFAGTWGAALVVGMWWLNSRVNSPIMPMSVGAIGALLAGGMANILHIFGVVLH
jgi:hypothetical protein